MVISMVPSLLNIGDNSWDIAIIHNLQNELRCNAAIGTTIGPLLVKGNRPIDPNVLEEEEDKLREEAGGFRKVDNLF
jgi:hypothetical protein